MSIEGGGEGLPPPGVELDFLILIIIVLIGLVFALNLNQTIIDDDSWGPDHEIADSDDDTVDDDTCDDDDVSGIAAHPKKEGQTTAVFFYL